MNSESIKKIAVVGAGTMGSGVAQTCARHGFEVVLRDLRADILDRAIAIITRNLDGAVQKGSLTEQDKTDTLRRITRTTRLSDVKATDLIIETIMENAESKKELFAELGEMCDPQVIFASNTSSISITALGTRSRRAANVIGMHFMYPVPRMKLVEVIKGQETSQATIDTVRHIVERLQKTAVVVNDSPGFISNRLLMPLINEAAFALMEGVAGKEAIDGIMMLGLSHPVGPLALADIIGLDVCLTSLEVIHDGFKDPKYRPCPLLRKLVTAGHLGRKTKKGFYDYGK